MSNERDTHFQGFAESHYLELSDLFAHMYACQITGDYSGADHARYAIKQLLAQRAYDLAIYCFVSVPDEKQSEYGDPPDCVKHVPDIDQWPDPYTNE